MFKDEEAFSVRMANYNKLEISIRRQHQGRHHHACIYEICDGLLSGETKYVYSVPDSNDEPFAGDKVAANNQRSISELKMKLREADDHRNEDFVEKQRAFMETSEYSKLNTDLSPAETLVFQALVLKRLPVAFKESIGCGDSADFKSAGKVIAANMNAIAREFIRSILSEKSVNFSEELATMLNTRHGRALSLTMPRK